jgi:plastocyanin
LCILTVLACGAASVAAQRGRKPVTHTVTIDGTAFKPATLTIKAGDSVVWVNKDIVSHTATSTTPKVFESGTLDTGKSWKRIFKTKGDFPYFCRFHPTMKASLKVE